GSGGKRRREGPARRVSFIRSRAGRFAASKDDRCSKAKELQDKTYLDERATRAWRSIGTPANASAGDDHDRRNKAKTSIRGKKLAFRTQVRYRARSGKVPILLKKSKIERPQRSRECQFLVDS